MDGVEIDIGKIVQDEMEKAFSEKLIGCCIICGADKISYQNWPVCEECTQKLRKAVSRWE